MDKYAILIARSSTYKTKLIFTFLDFEFIIIFVKGITFKLSVIRELHELHRKAIRHHDLVQSRSVGETLYQNTSPVGGTTTPNFNRQSRRSSIRSFKHDDSPSMSHNGGNAEIRSRKVSHDRSYTPLDELVQDAIHHRRQSVASKHYQSDGDSSRRKTPTSDEQVHNSHLNMSLPSSNYELNQLNDDQSTASLIMSEVMLRRNMSAGSKSEFDGDISSPHASMPVEDIIDDLPSELDPQAEINLASRTGSTSDHVGIRLSRHNSSAGKSPIGTILRVNFQIYRV